MFGWIAVRLRFRYCTKADTPPWCSNTSFLSSRSSMSSMRTPEFRNESSRRRFASQSYENVVLVKIVLLGLKRMVVPRSVVVPTTLSGPWGSPILYCWRCSLPSRAIVSVSAPERALTTDTPTPCRPPATLYELSSNLPPACSTVMMTSAAERFSSLWMSVGMPRPLSVTVTDSSAWMVTTMRSQWPPRASSIELSTTSKTMWCRPVPSSVSPMYMPGRLRTASRPFNTLILVES